LTTLKSITIVGTLFTASLSYAGLIAPQSVTNLEQKATLIVVASPAAAPNGTPNSFLLQVNRVVKGDNTLTGVPSQSAGYPLPRMVG
jgi:hypothetical protein